MSMQYSKVKKIIKNEYVGSMYERCTDNSPGQL